MIIINILVLLLSYSRYRVYQLSLSKTRDVLFHLLDHSYQQIEGVPHEILTDNMKTVMDEPRTYLQRLSDVEEGDSGWYIGDINNVNSSNLYAIHAFELLKEKPESIKYLVLPNDYMIIIEDNSVKAILNEKDVNILA